MEPIEKLKNVLVAFNNNEVTWVQVAEAAITAKNSGVEIKDLQDRIPKSPNRIYRMIKGYKFLKAQRPDLLNSSNPPNFDVLAYLPGIYKRTKGNAARDEAFQALIEEAVNGKLTVQAVTKISKKAKADKSDPKPVVEEKKTALTDDIATMSALDANLRTLEYILENTLKYNSYEALRKIMGPQCFSLANQLYCIADAEFHKMWKQRREVQL